jgi:hypothetical protein
VGTIVEVEDEEHNSGNGEAEFRCWVAAAAYAMCSRSSDEKYFLLKQTSVSRQSRRHKDVH